MTPLLSCGVHVWTLQVDKILGKTAPPEFIEQLRELALKHHDLVSVDVVRAYHFGQRYLVGFVHHHLPAHMDSAASTATHTGGLAVMLPSFAVILYASLTCTKCLPFTETLHMCTTRTSCITHCHNQMRLDVVLAC